MGATSQTSTLFYEGIDGQEISHKRFEGGFFVYAHTFGEAYSASCVMDVQYFNDDEPQSALEVVDGMGRAPFDSDR